MSSRFAVLDSEVDLNEKGGKKKQEKPKVKNDENAKKVPSKPTNKKKKVPADDPSLQALAFGTKGKNKKKPVVKGAEGNQKELSPEKTTNGQVQVNAANVDDDWQRRDHEFVRDENERSLREAIMLSKLDFEEKKDFYAQMKKEQKDDHKGGKVKKKKDKPLTMSLDEFNSLRPEQLTGKPEPVPAEQPPVQEANPEDKKFFDNVEEATKKTLERESRHENYKATAGQYNQEIRVSQCEADLEKRDFEIQALRLEVDSLKDELKLVKGRNKKLCEVICSAEMKSKGELVVELDKMTKVREELTQEVLNLSGQLEQERSKVNQLTSEIRKSSGKKKHNAEASHKD